MGGVDFDAIRKKLAKLNGGSRSSSWKPKEGEEHTVRLLSFPDNDGQPFKELYFYYNIGSNPGLLTLSQSGKPDPVQELITKLRAEGTKESYELAKKLYPKMRTYAPVVVRGEEEKGVQIWGFGKTVYQDLLGLMLDEDYGDITDPLSGRDIKVACNKLPGKKWAMTSVRPRPKETPLSKNPETASTWMSSIPNIDDMFTEKTYDELSKIINDWLVPEGESPDDSGTTRGGGGSTHTSLDDAFKELEDS